MQPMPRHDAPKDQTQKVKYLRVTEDWLRCFIRALLGGIMADQFKQVHDDISNANKHTDDSFTSLNAKVDKNHESNTNDLEAIKKQLAAIEKDVDELKQAEQAEDAAEKTELDAIQKQVNEIWNYLINGVSPTPTPTGITVTHGDSQPNV